MARPSRPRSLYPPPDSDVTVLTEANALAAPFWNTRTVPLRSAKNRRPSGAKAKAVAKSAARGPLGGDWAGSAHGVAAVLVEPLVVVVTRAVVVVNRAAVVVTRAVERVVGATVVLTAV